MSLLGKVGMGDKGWSDGGIKDKMGWGMGDMDGWVEGGGWIEDRG